MAAFASLVHLSANGETGAKISERVDAIDYGDIFHARFGNASRSL